MYLTGTINTNQVCQARNMIQTPQINSGDMLMVEPGCYIWTMDHVISADVSEKIKFKNKIKVLNVAKLKHFYENVEKSVEKEGDA
jgi:hypothetical protein